MTAVAIGLLHPGEMGAAVGGELVGRGHEVLWVTEGRSQATAGRAAAAGLSGCGLADLVQSSDVILSICPPHAAVDVAAAVRGFHGVFVDANAVSPATSRRIASLIEADAGRYVDGGIIGPPPTTQAPTALYLSGSEAGTVAGLFDGSAVRVRVMEGGPGAASAVKMAYAAWTKGTAALLLAIRAFAQAEGVDGALLAEWAESQPALDDRSRRAAWSALTKGWRWVAEMEEIGASFDAAGLPAGFHLAAAEVFARSPRQPIAAAEGAALDTVISALLEERAGSRP